MTDVVPMATFDTNVLVSGLLSPTGPPGRIVDWLALAAVQSVVDDRIAHEYEQVLKRPELDLPRRDVEIILSRILNGALWVSVPPEATVTGLPDPSDAPFAECSLTAGSILVTENKRHFPRSAIGKVTVWSPRQFTDRLAAKMS